jgi:hypothetical protein
MERGRRIGGGETTTGSRALVSEMSWHARDAEDARRTAHNPATAGPAGRGLTQRPQGRQDEALDARTKLSSSEVFKRAGLTYGLEPGWFEV